jgi:RNA polymerase sigma-70 factor (ECF subfamily)
MDVEKGNELSDTELVQDALKDIRCFALLIDRYKNPLARYIRRLGARDIHQIEDILQEVFIKIYRTLNTYDATRSFSSWTYRIAHNQTIDTFRSQTHQNISLEAEPELENMLVTTLEDIYSAADRHIDQAHLARAIALLDQKYRDVIILKYLEEKSYDEIADILHKPPGTIAILLRRAKEKLRILLEAKYQL